MQDKEAGLYEMQDVFWGLQTALQQSCIYFHRLVVLNNPELSKRQQQQKAKDLIGQFKNQHLEDKETSAWNHNKTILT